MECPECHTKNPKDANYCYKCATILTSSAPDIQSFNEKIDKIQRYLPEGITQKILEQKDRIEGERKQVTVLFCDMVGFTPMTEKLGPEKTYSIMDQVFEILIHKVHDYGGTVNQLVGDELYALFGVPIAIEDAASRAIRAGIAMHKDITEFSSKFAKEADIPPLRMRIGINSGPVVVGTIGNSLRVEFKAVGDTVNLASRMEGLAEPGTINVTKETYKQARLYFEFESLGEKEVKGKEKPVSIYKVVSEKEKVHRRLTSGRIIQSELVGRESEIDKLAFQVLKAKNGEGSIINVIGEAGIGKSRLIAELKNNDAVKRTTILEGRALSMGRNLSFYPIIEILKGLAGIVEDDTATEQLHKLEKAVRNIHSEHTDEIIPFIASLMGMQLSGNHAERVKGIEGEALENLIYKNLKDFILKLAEVSPLIFIFEDLHWADTSSIDLIVSLCKLVENRRILIINIFRPFYEETSEKLKKAVDEEYSSFYSEINLHRLQPDLSDQLISNLLKIEGLPTNIKDQIKERSGGNPFFIEEMARSMIDEGAIEIKEDKFSITSKIDTMVVPNTVQELLMSRIDRLDETTKSLLRTASVIGRHFFHKILMEVFETVDNIDDKLGHLQEIQLIREGKRMEEVEFIFKHALAQEVAYESILQEKRKEIHLKVAEAIERVFIERRGEFYGTLAYHYIKAECPDKAETYMIRAGEESLKSSASSEALHYFQNAMKLYTENFGEAAELFGEAAELTKMTVLEENIALALFNKGKNVEAADYFDRVLDRLGLKEPRLETTTFLSFLLNNLIFSKNLYFPPKIRKELTAHDKHLMYLIDTRARALFTINPFRGINAILQGAIASLRYEINHSQHHFNIILAVAFMSLLFGHLKRGKRILDYLNKAIIQKEFTVSTHYYDCQSILYALVSGNWRDEFSERPIYEAVNEGDFFSASLTANWTYSIYLHRGDFMAVDRMLLKLENISNSFDNPTLELVLLNCLGWYHYKKRNLDFATLKLRQCVALAKNTGDVAYTYLLGIILQLQILKRDLDAAENTYSEINKVYFELIKLPPMHTGPILLGCFMFHIDKLDQPENQNNSKSFVNHEKEARRFARETLKGTKKYVTYRPEIYRYTAIYYWLINKQKKARKWFDKSIKEGERLGAIPELSRTYMELGKRLMEPKSKLKHLSGITAEEYLEKARVMFEEMDLQWDLEQLDKVRAEIDTPTN